MSDPIEGRFGWYRLVNGGNFYMSVKQVLHAEKKIRKLSFLQQQALMSGAGLFAQDLSPVNSSNIETVQKDVTWLHCFVRCQSGFG